MFCTKEEPTSFLLHCKKKNKIRQSTLFSLLLVPKSLDAIVTWNLELLCLFLRLVMPLGSPPSSSSPAPILHLLPGKDLTVCSGAEHPQTPLYPAPALAQRCLTAPTGCHEKPPVPRVRVRGGSGAAELSLRNSLSGLGSSIFSACVSAEHEGWEGLYRGCLTA